MSARANSRRLLAEFSNEVTSGRGATDGIVLQGTWMHRVIGRSCAVIERMFERAKVFDDAAHLARV
jgi:hypothetical protein